MDLDLDKGLVMIFDKKYKLEALATKLSGLSGEQVYGFFSNRGLLLPRQINCMAITSILNEKIKSLMSNSLTKDSFQRLLYYKYFTETQLQSLFMQIATPDDFKLYRISFFKLILLNFVSLNLTDGEVQYLITLRKQTPVSFEKYNSYVAGICCEQEGTFDGQSITLLKSYLASSITTADLTAISTKYGLEIPQRLNKEQLVEYITSILNERGENTEEIAKSMVDMPITGLIKLCKEKGIDMSANMSKQQTIDYLFFYLSLCDIVTSSIHKIEHSEEYEPLEFTIDFSVPMGFSAKEPQKVIFYKHTIINENGTEEVVEEQLPQKSADNKVKKSYVMRSRHQPAEVATEEVSLDASSSIEDIPAEVPVADEVTEMDTPVVEETVVEEEKPVVEEETITQEPVQEAPVTNPESEKLSMDEVYENTNFESNKYINLGKSKAGMICVLVILGLLVALVIYIICSLL